MKPQLLYRDLVTDDDIRAAAPLMRELRGDMVVDSTFVEDVQEQRRQGYQLLGAFADDQLVALAGIRRQRTMSRGWHLFIDDLVTTEGKQHQGIGKGLMAHLDTLAASEGLPSIYLDSRATAKTFYGALGFQFLSSIPCFKTL